ENSQIAELSEVKKRMNPIEKKTLLVLVSLIAFWMTESIHGYDIAYVAMVGAILVMAPTYGIISRKQGMKSVSWNLIIFVAAAAALEKMLVATRVVRRAEKEMLFFLQLLADTPAWQIVLAVLLVSVTSHLYI